MLRAAAADGSAQHALTQKWKKGEDAPNGADHYEGGPDISISWDPRTDLITFSHWEKFKVGRVGSTHSSTISCCSIYDIPADHPKPDELRVRFDLLDDEARFHPSNNNCPAWSPSGKYLAFVRNGDVWIAERGKLIWPAAPPRPSRDWTVWQWDVSRLDATADYDAPTYRGSRENYFVTRLSWSPHGDRLMFGRQRINGSGTQDITVLRVTEK